MDKKRNGLIFGCFVAFYVILVVERLVSVFVTLNEIGFQNMFAGAKYNMYVYGMSLLSVGIFAIVFLFGLGKVLSVGVERSYKLLIISAGILLVGSKIRTEHSIVVLQYVAYAALMLAFLFRYFDIRQETCLNSGYTTSSFVYLALYIIAIPVVRKTQAGNQNVGFYVVEAIGSIALVVMFIIMACMLFGDKYKSVNNIFFLIAMLAVVGLMTLLVIGQPDFNLVIFPLIAAAATLVAFIVNRATSKKLRRM